MSKTNHYPIEEIQKIIGIKFRNPKILKESFVHRSFINENRSLDLSHNERLEFLGDATLELVVSEYLFRQKPPLEEGEMTKLKGALVNNKALGQIFCDLGLESFLLMSQGEKNERNETQIKTKISAGALEAIIGAVYLDRGFGTASLFAREFILPRLEVIRKTKEYIDPKSYLQELAQEKLRLTPRYLVVNEIGPDHAKIFGVGVYFNERLIAIGQGGNKKEAEMAAAKNALRDEFRLDFDKDVRKEEILN